MNRAFSIRSSNRSGNGTASSAATGTGASTTPGARTRRGFSLAALRESIQHQPPPPPELSKQLQRLVKAAGRVVGAHAAAGRERAAAAARLAEWGAATGDEGVADVSDKVGAVLAEAGAQEAAYGRALEAGRAALKAARDVERSVRPSREGKRRVAAEIARLKGGHDSSSGGGSGGGGSGARSARLVTLEQQLVRAEAENLVAEAQLANVTRQKLKEAYTLEFLATVERAEKQIILARHGLRLLQLLDDSPVVPGDVRPPYTQASQARQILNDAEDDLRDWRLDALSLLGGDDDDGDYDDGDAHSQGGGQGLEKREGGEGEGEQENGEARGTEMGNHDNGGPQVRTAEVGA